MSNSIKMVDLSRFILDSHSSIPNRLVFKDINADVSRTDLFTAIDMMKTYLESEEYINATKTFRIKRNEVYTRDQSSRIRGCLWD